MFVSDESSKPKKTDEHHESIREPKQPPLTLSDVDRLTTSSSSNRPISSSSSGEITIPPPAVHFSQPPMGKPSNSGNKTFDKTISKLVAKQRSQVLPSSLTSDTSAANKSKKDSMNLENIKKNQKVATDFGPEVKSYFTYDQEPKVIRPREPLIRNPTSNTAKKEEKVVKTEGKQMLRSNTGEKAVDTTKTDGEKQFLRKLELQLEEHQREYRKMQQKMQVQLQLQIRDMELQSWRTRQEKKALNNAAWRHAQQIQTQKDVMEKQKERINKQKLELEQARQNQALSQQRKASELTKQVQHTRQDQPTHQLTEKEINDMLIQRTLEKNADRKLLVTSYYLQKHN